MTLSTFVKLQGQERPQPSHLPVHHQNMLFPKDLGPSLKDREMEKLSPFTIPSVTSSDVVYRPREKEMPTRTETRKRYMCDICRKSFQQVCQLKQHRRIHTGRGHMKRVCKGNLILVDFTFAFLYHPKNGFEWVAE